VTEQPSHRRTQRTERQPVTSLEHRRRLAVFGAHSVIPGVEDDGGQLA
jgi:hypothetical protein